jgi:gamma-glutamyl:cysteine ligase YbdK (ATP-grasp superfamily)
MSKKDSRLHLFDAYGIELEYMLVDRDTLAVKPITDELLKLELGQYGSDFENGIITWSNELVLHVVEIKSSKPESDFAALEKGFAENVKQINKDLLKWNAMLMPSAAHPLMNPAQETKLWPHDSNEVYDIYNKIFDCKGHGWSNLQSTHLNLPFTGDEEFARLHAAIRLVLPLLPALCASSPLLEGKASGYIDTRLTYYKTNQAKIPSITGQVIPEALFSEKEYAEVIYKKISADVARYNEDDILDPIWVNSRGAIPRFDRGSIEIRVMDIQECPSADLAIVALVIETLKALVNQELITFEKQKSWNENSLVGIFDQTVKLGQKAIINNTEYLKIFGLDSSASALEIWLKIVEHLKNSGNSAIQKWDSQISTILSHGTLADRILIALGGDFSEKSIKKVYTLLSDCLAKNTMFKPN